jgi:hypothetical protein
MTLRALRPTPDQQRSIISVVAEDIERRPFGHQLSIADDFLSSVELCVHEAACQPVDGDIFQAIPESPTVSSPDGRVTLLVGAMAVGGALAASLSVAISSDDRLTLLVPHAYAMPSEVESLQDSYGGSVVTFSENVYVRFDCWHADPEIIRGALTNMIGGYSVAWLFDDAGALARPVVAVVSVFDGDGFALIAGSRTSATALLPGIPDHP